MAKHTIDQTSILNALTGVHRDRVNARAELRQKIEDAYGAELYELKLQEASLMIKGADAGLPKSVLGRAIGTSDWKTIQDMLDLGRQMVPVPTLETTDAFTGYIIMTSAGHDVYLAIQDASNPDAEFTLGNGITYPGFKVVLDTQVTPARPLENHNAVPANHPAAVWAVDNWKNLPTKPYGDTGA